MHSRYSVALLVAAGFAFACGPRSRANVPGANHERPKRQVAKKHADKPVIVSSLDVRQAGAEVRFVFRVANEGGKTAELLFPDGRTHEVVVLDSVGREVWRSSTGRLFTQAIRSKMLGTTETLRYEDAWARGAARGSFVAVAVLRSDNHPVERRVPFTVN